VSASTGSTVVGSSSTDREPVVTTPRLLDRYYQDEDLVIVDQRPPPSSGWLQSAVTNQPGHLLPLSSTTAQLYQKLAPHVATFVGVGAWLRLAYRLRRRRQTSFSTPPTNATVVLTTTLASNTSSHSDHDDAKITREAAESMVQTVQAQWQERYAQLEMQHAVGEQQRNEALVQLAATAQQCDETTLELSQLQMVHNATLEQCSAAQRQSDDAEQQAKSANEQQQALQVQLAAVQEQLDDTRQQLDAMQQQRDNALVQRDEQLVQVASLNNAVAAAHENAAQTTAQELAEYQEQAQKRHVDELRRFSESVLAIVDAEQSEFVANVQEHLARVVRSVYYDGTEDSAPVV
jgi:hypothetical protein